MAENKINVLQIVQTPNTKTPINFLFKKTDTGKVLFIGEYMEIYLPVSNFDRKMSEIKGRIIETYGLFNIYIWDKEPKDATILPTYKTRYNFPSKIVTIPTSMTKKTLEFDGLEDRYLVLSYRKNDIFINSTIIPKLVMNMKNMLNLVFEAFAPDIVKYEELPNLITDCSRINDVEFGVSATVIEMIVSELARYKKDPTIPFRMIINKKGLDKINIIEDYFLMKLTDLPHIKSTFTSISFQNIDYAVTASAKRHRKGEQEEISPVERVIKY